MNMHSSVEDWLKLSDAFYRASMSTDMKVKVPVIWGTDAVHGHNNVYGATLFPHNIGLGAAHDPKAPSNASATQLPSRFEQRVSAGPSHPRLRWSRIRAGAGPTRATVRIQSWCAPMARRWCAAFRASWGSSTSVLATAKHYLGDGGTWHGKDQGETRTSEANLVHTHAAGYYGALKANVQTVMVSYSSFTDTATGKHWGKMHGDGYLVGRGAEEALGFNGLVVSDWNGDRAGSRLRQVALPSGDQRRHQSGMVPDDWKNSFHRQSTTLEPAGFR